MSWIKIRPQEMTSEFTLDILISGTNLRNQSDLCKVGRHISDSYKARYGKKARKKQMGKLWVNVYPREFAERACVLANRYSIRKLNRPVAPLRKRRNKNFD